MKAQLSTSAPVGTAPGIWQGKQTAARPEARRSAKLGTIEFVGVTKNYGTRRVLSDVTFSVAPGEVVVICGPSGSGKSTLLRCVNGLETVQSGTIHVDGIEVTARGTDLQALRAKIGFVFQSFNLYPHMTALQNIAIAPVLVNREHRQAARARAMALLERIGLADKADSYPTQLSGGQQQRVAIARALAMQPRVMLFDEPTSALDPEMIREVLSLMMDLASEDMTMLVVTHELGFARRLADRMIFMDHGRLIADAAPQDFFERQGDERIRQFLDHVLHH